MSDNTHGNHGHRHQETQTEDRTDDPGQTYVTEQTVDIGRDGIRRKMIRRRMVTESSEKREG